MNSLLITLGHGSSALFVYDKGSSVIGYEQERLSGIKADSQFPKDAINEIINNIGIHKMSDCNIYISHWFNDCTPDNKAPQKVFESKYMTHTDHLNLLNISKKIIFVDKNFTHHDAHAWSAFSFFEQHLDNTQIEPYSNRICTIVADGFGTNEEVLSIYESIKEDNKISEPRLIKRVFGYDASIGLMYQYATSFCGMKENQDEYKFLGYESHIDEYLSGESIDALDHLIEYNVTNLKKMFDAKSSPEDGIRHALCDEENIINFNKLSNIRKYWYTTFQAVLESIDFVAENKETHDFVTRCIIAYFVQQTVEIYFSQIIHDYDMSNVIVAGGCFYNVKLNNRILESIPGLFCAMPLAGDQGAAIGMYRKFTGENFNFGNLLFGKRRMYNAEKVFSNKKGIYYFKVAENGLNKIATSIANAISDGNLVNIIYGNMEFGPRALCSTSTLFLPTKENVANNNHMNNRNEVMPCAPVCTQKNAEKLFGESIHRVVGSNRFMICTHEYEKPFSNQYAGVMHKKTLEDNIYTGRPQIVSEKEILINMILNKVEAICDAKCLVNTSFNVHGRPIVFDVKDILQNFEYQREHAVSGKEPLLFVIK